MEDKNTASQKQKVTAQRLMGLLNVRTSEDCFSYNTKILFVELRINFFFFLLSVLLTHIEHLQSLHLSFALSSLVVCNCKYTE